MPSSTKVPQKVRCQQTLRFEKRNVRHLSLKVCSHVTYAFACPSTSPFSQCSNFTSTRSVLGLFTCNVCVCVKGQQLVIWQQVMVFILNIKFFKNATSKIKGKRKRRRYCSLKLTYTKRSRQHQRQHQCFEWVLTLTLGMNGTGIYQCNPSTSGDTDAWCEWHRYKSM